MNLLGVCRACKRDFSNSSLRIVLVLAGWLAWECARSAQAGPAGSEPVPARLGRGVNVLGYDPIWQNFERARFQARHFQAIKAGGFDTVRVNLHPFSHMEAAPGYRLREAWFRTADWIVTNALASGLTVILDFHEFNQMGRNPEGNREKFLAFWRQVGAHYREASPRVLFEILNEPCEKLTPQLWNQYLAEALAIIRAENPRRTVIIGPAFWNAIEHLDELSLPETDQNLVLTVHYYKPMAFTHQGASWSSHKDKVGVDWLGTPEEISAVSRDFQKAQAWAQKRHLPVLLGEFGAYDKAGMDARVRYTAHIARAAEQLGWGWAYWQFDSDFIVYDIPRDQWVEPILRALIPAPGNAKAAGLGEFEGFLDTGKTYLPGKAIFDPATGQYRITGSGDNIWGQEDAFHFVRRALSGDFALAGEVAWVGTGKNAHRKACLMVRQNLEADAPYVDAAVHGDGLISLQYRRVKGGPTAEVQVAVKAPARLRLDRIGQVFTLFAAPPGAPFRSAGLVMVELVDPVEAGLAVCSHDNTVAETAVFSNVQLHQIPLKIGR